MDPAELRALLAAHPAVAIEPFGVRRDVRCVRIADALALVERAGHVVDEAELHALLTALGGQRLRLVDPAGPEGAGPTGRTGARPPRARRGRVAPQPRRAKRGAPPLEALDVYELPARVFTAGA
ncbi:hypothetical protein [Patulibacter americanus]|uniref:hypothetical protein n=1 Tax=Patulibacter americanus TaxID=588672 RepID=UPI0003B6B80C|nr:hypothetical protein [Patulibacter americanus]